MCPLASPPSTPRTRSTTVMSQLVKRAEQLVAEVQESEDSSQPVAVGAQLGRPTPGSTGTEQPLQLAATDLKPPLSVRPPAAAAAAAGTSGPEDSDEEASSLALELDAPMAK